jgi:Domain of unknown function (DUF5671)
MENNTAKHFVLQLGSFITLYLSVAFLLVLIFAIINLIFPDPTENYYVIEGASNSVRMGIAMLIVFFPTFIFLTRKVNEFRRQETNGAYLGLTKWLVYLSLLVGGGVLLGDLVAVILAFLNGELTIRFALKALVLVVIVGSAFFYYLKDTKGYWMKKEKMSIAYGGAMSTIVLISLVVGFFHIETPTLVREMKLDETQLYAMQEVQGRVEMYLQSNGALPQAIKDVYLTDSNIPVAPEDREAYSFKFTTDSFSLCANFSNDSQPIVAYESKMMAGPSVVETTKSKFLIENAQNWEYTKGRFCFERKVSPVTY